MGEAPAKQTVDEIAEALLDDPVQVDPLFGNGHTDEVHATLTDTVQELDFPAYVVLVSRPDGLSANDPDRELATLLHDRIGGDGVFLVHTDELGYGVEVASFGDVPDHYLPTTTALKLAPDGGANASLSPAGIVARNLDILDQGGEMTREEFDSYAEQTVWRDPPEWDLDYEVPSAGTFAVFTTMAFVVVAGCAWLLLRNLARWRESAPRTRKAVVSDQSPARTDVGELGEAPAQVRLRAERELEALAKRMEATADRSVQPADRVLVDGSYDTARSILEHTTDDDRDLDDLVGALVLVRIAARASASQRKASVTYRPCFFDPRHGEGTHRRTVPVSDRDLTVPVCKRCGRTRAESLAPMQVAGGRLGRLRPWYEHDTVWARTGYGAFVDDLWDHVASERRSAR